MTFAMQTYPLNDLVDALQASVDGLARSASAPGTPRVEFERPREERFGDFATNVALMLAPVMGQAPREVAASLQEQLAGIDGVAAVDVAGPGFINVTMADDWFAGVLAAVLAAGERYGAGVVAEPEQLHLEFVSANPLGPLTAASGRHAAYGDSLGRILRFAGHRVHTEYYLNDRGRQVRLFGESIHARATGGEVPEDGYRGAYVAELAESLGATASDDPAVLGRRGIEAMTEQVRATLERFGVAYDAWQSEQALHDDGTVDDAIAALREAGHLYESEGATFLRTTSFGDDKDRAIVRADGDPTYFASDLGYIVHKHAAAIDRAIYVLGADHHGYIGRMTAANQLLGHAPASLEVLILQMVHLTEAGEQKKLSKRAGTIVTLDEIIDRIGVDAARYFLIQRSHDQSVEIDLDLAVEQSDANPVYYIQYAHARICSILRKVEDELGIPAGVALEQEVAVPGELLPAERRLVKRLAEYPTAVAQAAERRAVHRIPVYMHELAQDFASFYRDCRVMGDGIERPTTIFRMQLCLATRRVLATSLDLIGVSAPERM